MKTGFSTRLRPRVIEVSTGRGYPVKEETGKIRVDYTSEERLPHPTNMSKYDDWANDPEASIAFNVLTDIIAGVGHYTEMPEEYDEEHQHKKRIDKYSENVNLDEDLQEIVMAMLQKGFCPVQRLSDYDLKILPPETFYIYQDKQGNVLKYTQERSRGDVISTWEDSDKDDIILFFHRKTTSWPYGKSLVEPIGPLLDERSQMNEDMPKAVHRWAYPIPVMQTSGSKTSLQSACEDRDIDDWIFIGNVEEGEVRFDTIAIDPQARFIPYIELIYYQICEGLHAPLLLYLKNATEASATVMMESVDRLVNGIQRYIKRRVERYLYEPQVGNPVPRLVWGQPKTGLEEITLTDVAAVLPYLAKNQQLDLLQQFGIQLPEAEVEPQQQLPFQPFQKTKPEIPVEQVLEKLNDVETGLNIIVENYYERKISITEACRLADRTITVHMKRAYPSHWKEHRDMKFQQFLHERLLKRGDGKTYSVTVNQ